MFNGDKTYDNRTGKIQQNWGTTYKKENHRVAGTCNYGSCPHGGEGDGNANKVQGHIQLASKSGLRPGMHAGTAEKSRSISRQARNRLEGKEGWDLQVPGLLARWNANEVAWVVHGCVIIM